MSKSPELAKWKSLIYSQYEIKWQQPQGNSRVAIKEYHIIHFKKASYQIYHGTPKHCNTMIK